MSTRQVYLKYSLFLFLMLSASLGFSQEWKTITGRVVRVRQGQATFYTVIALDGAEHLANSAHPQVGQNEEVFRKAHEEQTPLHIEFRSHVNNPGSIWQIRRIEPVRNLAGAEPPPVSAVAPRQEVIRSFSVAGIFRDRMVLQRDRPVPVWGWAESGAAVSVDFAGQTKSAVASGSGTWRVDLDPMSASFEPRVMTVQSSTGRQKLEIGNVLVGDVWLLGGQSNMDWWLQASDGGAEAAAQADYPWLRLFDPGWQLPDEPAVDVSPRASWTICTPGKAGQFSAIGFWVAENLYNELNIPVGLLKTSVSGTYGESWVPREVLESIPSARPRLEEYAAALQKLPEETARWQREKAEHEQAVAEARRRGKAEPAPSFFVRKGPMGPDHFHRPYALYNGRIAPLMPFAVRGVVWYQGEGNSQKHRAGYYKDILEGLVGSWREGWQQERLPFLIVQLPKFKPGPHNDWPLIREAQREAALALEDTGLVVTIDTGDPEQIHPTDKKTVADRVAALALQQVYGKAVSGRSPAPVSVEQTGDGFLVRFADAGNGLLSRDDILPGFEVAGSDGKFIQSVAEIVSSNTVKLVYPDCTNPITFRYAYSGVPDATLFSADGLPVVPFVLHVSGKE